MEPKEQSAQQDELDREEQQLRDEAVSISPPRPEDAEIEDDSTRDRRATPNEKQPSTKTERTASDKPADAAAANKAAKDSKATTPEKPDAKADTAPSPDKTKETAPDETKLTPYQKERRRLDESWKKVQAEKDALRKDRETLEAQTRAIQEQQQQAAAKPAAKAGPSPDDYDEIARDYEAEGKLALAKTCRAKAAELRQQQAASPAPEAKRERFTPEEVRAMTAEWNTNLVRLAEENPELKEDSSPLRVAVAKLLKDVPVFAQSAKGIVYAVEIGKMTQRAARAEALEARTAELTKEVERLTQLTAITGGAAKPRSEAPKFGDLSIDEQEHALRDEAATADSR